MFRIVSFSSAVSKIQAVLIIIVIVIAAVATGYFYQSRVSPQQPTPTPPTSVSPSPSLISSPAPSPAPAALKVTKLFIDPIEAWVDQPINVSVNVLNTGNQEINYSLPFSVDGKVVQSVQVLLTPHEGVSATATLNESSIGSYRATVIGLGTTFRVV